MVGPNRRAGDVAVILARSLHAPVTEGELATREDVPVSALAQALMVRSQDLDGRVVWVLDGVSSPAVDPRALGSCRSLPFSSRGSLGISSPRSCSTSGMLRRGSTPRPSVGRNSGQWRPRTYAAWSG